MTTTTSPRPASRAPSASSSLLVPLENAPGWNHTITGRRAVSVAGVHRFRCRQSSLIATPRIPGCGATGPNATASATPVHGTGGAGGWNRRAAVSAP